MFSSVWHMEGQMRRTTLELGFLPWHCHRILFLNIPCISSIGFLSVMHDLRH